MGNQNNVGNPGPTSGQTGGKGKRILFVVIAVAIVSFVAGKWYGGVQASGKTMEEQMRNWDKFAKLDESVLQTLPVRSNTMKSGNYIMQMWFADGSVVSNTTSLTCANGQVQAAKFKRNGDPEILVNSGSIASWTEEGALYEANAICVGVVDGDNMWGHIYGWNPGDQSVGLWRIYPAAKTTASPLVIDRNTNVLPHTSP